MSAELRVPVGELLGRPGAQRRVSSIAALELAAGAAEVTGAVGVELVIDAVLGGLSVTGVVSAPYVAECRRCLARIDGDVSVEVSEIFEADPTEGETYPIAHDEVDLEPLAREAVLLALPLAPLCAATCAGPDPDRYPATPVGEAEPRPDPRWAALDVLRDDPGSPGG